MVFTCHLSLTVGSFSRIDSISSKAQSKIRKSETSSVVPHNSHLELQMFDTTVFAHARALTQLLNRDLGVWVYRGVYACRIWTVNLGRNCVWEKDRCVLNHQDSKFPKQVLWKGPHSYSNRLTATNSQTKHSKTPSVDGCQLTGGKNWFMFYGISAVYGRSEGLEEKKRTSVLHVYLYFYV